MRHNRLVGAMSAIGVGTALGFNLVMGMAALVAGAYDHWLFLYPGTLWSLAPIALVAFYAVDAMRHRRWY